MGLLSFVDKSIVNSKLSDVIAKYDTDKNGFTKKEFRTAVSGITNKITRSLIKFTGIDKTLFKELDTNKNSIVSYDEIADYIDKEYGLDFYSFSNMTIMEICNALDNAKKNKNSFFIEQKDNEIDQLA